MRQLLKIACTPFQCMHRYKIYRADSISALQNDCSKYAAPRSDPLSTDVIDFSEDILRRVVETHGSHAAITDGPSTRVNADAENTTTEMEKCQDPQPPIEIIPCAYLWNHRAAGRSMISGLQREKNCVCQCKLSHGRILAYIIGGIILVNILCVYLFLFSHWIQVWIFIIYV